MKRVVVILVLLFSIISVKAAEVENDINEKFYYEYGQDLVEFYFDADLILNVEPKNLEKNYSCSVNGSFFEEDNNLIDIYNYEFTVEKDDLPFKVKGNGTNNGKVKYYKMNYHCTELEDDYEEIIIDDFDEDKIGNLADSIINIICIIAGILTLFFVIATIVGFTKFGVIGKLRAEKFRAVLEKRGFKIENITNDFKNVNLVLRGVMDDYEVTYYEIMEKDIFIDVTKQLGSENYNLAIQNNHTLTNEFVGDFDIKSKYVYYKVINNRIIFANCDKKHKKYIEHIIGELIN